MHFTRVLSRLPSIFIYLHLKIQNLKIHIIFAARRRMTLRIAERGKCTINGDSRRPGRGGLCESISRNRGCRSQIQCGWVVKPPAKQIRSDLRGYRRILTGSQIMIVKQAARGYNRPFGAMVRATSVKLAFNCILLKAQQKIRGWYIMCAR